MRSSPPGFPRPRGVSFEDTDVDLDIEEELGLVQSFSSKYGIDDRAQMEFLNELYEIRARRDVRRCSGLLKRLTPASWDVQDFELRPREMPALTRTDKIILSRVKHIVAAIQRESEAYFQTVLWDRQSRERSRHHKGNGWREDRQQPGPSGTPTPRSSPSRMDPATREETKRLSEMLLDEVTEASPEATYQPGQMSEEPLEPEAHSPKSPSPQMQPQSRPCGCEECGGQPLSVAGQAQPQPDVCREETPSARNDDNLARDSIHRAEAANGKEDQQPMASDETGLKDFAQGPVAEGKPRMPLKVRMKNSSLSLQ